MVPIVLKEKPTPEDTSWNYAVSLKNLTYPKSKDGQIFGKFIKFRHEKIELSIAKMPNNRILQMDDSSKFILCSFSDLRFPDTPLRLTGEYILRLMKEGLFLNGIQYRFYHHSNSQLVSPRHL
jgi:hypothetical protein